MKITVTGSLGNISKPLSIRLIAAGHEVTIVSSKEEKAALIESIGAKAAIGQVTDVAFLTNAFNGTDVVYTMVPPFFGADDWRAWIGSIGENYAKAIKAAGVKRVVNLSSIGAHLDGGTGPIAGAHDVELTLNQLGLAVRHLRPAFFYNNYYNNIGMIKGLGLIGANYGGAARVLLIDPRDIADAAFEQISRTFTGTGIVYVVGDERDCNDVAAILGKATGNAQLPWVEFTDEQTLAALQQNGIPYENARNFVEMGAAARSGVLWEDYYEDKEPVYKGKIKLEQFAEEFAKQYNRA